MPASPLASVAVLHRLAQEAWAAQDPASLRFHILNSTHRLCAYDRAVLFEPAGPDARWVGVSGQASADPRSPLVLDRLAIVRALPANDQARLLDTGAGGDPEAWKRISVGAASVLWLPIVCEGRPVAGLWLERAAAFTEPEIGMLSTLAQDYGTAWRLFRPPLSARFRRTARRAFLLAAALALLFVRLPVRVFAPCEVVPDSPVILAAPLEGVIREIAVRPGQRVEAGEELLTYDTRVAEEERSIAERQVAAIAAELDRRRASALDEPRSRGEVPILEARLAQERIRLELAADRLARATVRAPVAGVVSVDRPEEWRGRPVRPGERILTLLDPARTRLRIWLPEKDPLEFDRALPVRVLLGAGPAETREATVRHIAFRCEPGPGGMPSFRAEADWKGEGAPPGLQGTAVLLGRSVPLWYWIFRKPLAAVRAELGL